MLRRGHELPRLTIRALDRETGKPDVDSVRWETHLDTEWASFRPILRGREILAGADDGHVHAFAIEDGEHLWSQDFGGPVTSLTDTGGEPDQLYVGTTRGLVFAMRFAADRVQPEHVEPEGK